MLPGYTKTTNKKKQYKKELKTQKDQFTLEKNKIKAEIKDKQKEIQNLKNNFGKKEIQMLSTIFHSIKLFVQQQL